MSREIKCNYFFVGPIGADGDGFSRSGNGLVTNKVCRIKCCKKISRSKNDFIKLVAIFKKSLTSLKDDVEVLVSVAVASIDVAAWTPKATTFK